jgi:hypothetical protein
MQPGSQQEKLKGNSPHKGCIIRESTSSGNKLTTYKEKLS